MHAAHARSNAARPRDSMNAVCLCVEECIFDTATAAAAAVLSDCAAEHAHKHTHNTHIHIIHTSITLQTQHTRHTQHTHSLKRACYASFLRKIYDTMRCRFGPGCAIPLSSCLNSPPPTTTTTTLSSSSSRMPSGRQSSKS